MAGRRPGPRGGWAYVTLVTEIPGRSVDPRLAVTIQLVLFEGVAIGLAAWYDQWQALPAATAAIAIATGGSGFMIALSARIQALSPPEPYRRALFDSSVDVVMGLVAFVLLVTVLFVGGPGSNGGFLVRPVGEPAPAAVVAFALVVGWDLSYRIGTAWWASITGLWRTLAFGSGFDERTRAGFVRVDALTISFAALQLILLPFLGTHRLLALAVVGHVVAVVVVSGLSIGLLRRR